MSCLFRNRVGAIRVGSVVYYNAELRKTVRSLPGYEPPQSPVETLREVQVQTREKEKDAVASEPTIPHTELTEQEDFVPIDFDKAMSIEGHESQVVHVSHR